MKLSLRHLRIINNKTQDDMAKMLSVHIQTYRKIEENPEIATIKQAKMISSYLGVTVDEIFFYSLSLLKEE
jgi:DNA-binding XRE family transcriptional regulator